MSMRLGAIAGIEIRVHYSALVIYGAIVAVIAYGYLPMVTPASSAGERIAVAAIVAVLLALSLVAHEFGHAVIANRRGKTVTSISLYLFGGTANIRGEPLSAGDEIAIALAGPAISLALTLLFGVGGIASFAKHPQAAILLFDIAIANGALAAFNLLPGFPMDGGRVLRGLIWRRSGNVIAATRRAALGGRIVAYMLITIGCLLAVRGSVFFGVWAAVIGWFQLGLAHQYYRATVLRTALEGLRVRDLRARDLPVLQTSDSTTAAAEHFGVGAKSRSLAVLFGDRPAGIVTDVDVARARTDTTAERTVGTIMTRISELPVFDPEEDALALVDDLPLSSVGAVMVADNDGSTFVGIVRREDIIRYVEMVEDLGNSTAASAKNIRDLSSARLQPGRAQIARDQGRT